VFGPALQGIRPSPAGRDSFRPSEMIDLSQHQYVRAVAMMRRIERRLANAVCADGHGCSFCMVLGFRASVYVCTITTMVLQRTHAHGLAPQQQSRCHAADVDDRAIFDRDTPLPFPWHAQRGRERNVWHVHASGGSSSACTRTHACICDHDHQSGSSLHDHELELFAIIVFLRLNIRNACCC
jgi:hypothetical protein